MTETRRELTRTKSAEDKVKLMEKKQRAALETSLPIDAITRRGSGSKEKIDSPRFFVTTPTSPRATDAKKLPDDKKVNFEKK